jgi:hypothetical protein
LHNRIFAGIIKGTSTEREYVTVTELSIYQTPNTLTLSYFSVVDDISVVSEGRYSLKPTQVKAKYWRTIKFSVNNGVLFVTYGRYRDSMKPIRGTVKYKMERLSPHIAGILGSYLRPEEVPLISAFIQRNFPNLEVKPASEYEMMAIEDDFCFYSRKITDSQKNDVVNLCLDIHAASFPLFSHFVKNRLSDGYYGGAYELESKSYHRAKDYKEFLTRMFGVYRKDLAKAVAASDISNILWAAGFAEILEIDSIIEALRENVSKFSGDMITKVDTLAGFPRVALKSLLAEGFSSNVDFILIEDALEMAPWVPEEERKFCRTWKELHDRGMAHYSYHEETNSEIEHTNEFEKFFAQAEIENHVISPLRNVASFISTGKRMDVCVGSSPYVRRAFAGDGYCFRVDKENNAPYALVEVLKSKKTTGAWCVNQIQGEKNCNIPEDFTGKIKTELAKFITLESGK